MPIIERPKFVGRIVLLTQLPTQLFMTFWAGAFLGGMTRSFLGIQGQAPFRFFGLLAFCVIPCVAYIGKKLNYSQTSYSFFEDRIEFEEGYFSRNRKVVMYRDVLEVSLRRGVLQRSCGLGTIYLGTLATGSEAKSNSFPTLGFGNVSASGIGIKDIVEPDAAYARIRRMVADAKAS